MMYSISVIVPVYNVVKYIDKCIDSLVAQTMFDRMEVLLVDDGSNDGSEKKCELYSQKYENVFCIHQENQGVSAARNAGLLEIKGEYVGFVDADDYVEPWYYERMYFAAKEKKADLVVFDYFLEFANSGEKKKYRKENREFSYDSRGAMKKYLSGSDIGVNLFDKLFKSEKINGIFFEKDIRIGEDLYFIFESIKKMEKVYGIAKAGYHYLQRSGSAMNGVFDKKYFDVLKVSEYIMKEINEQLPEYINYAEALYIHSAYKTLERAYKLKNFEKYSDELEEISRKIHNYSSIKAWKYLSKRQYFGFMLMKNTPKIYLKVCKIKKI